MVTRRDVLVSWATVVTGAAAMAAARVLASPATHPAEILIMRHAEEPDRGAHLSDRGRARAAALATLFPARFATPNFLFCARSSSKSRRPMETLQPLAASLGMKIDDSVADTQFKRLADVLLSRPIYAGTHVLICWHHATIPALAAALGVPRPPKWPERQYDHVWRIRYLAKAVTLADESERLLPDDGLPNPAQPGPR